MGTTEKLAGYVAGLDYEAIPENVRADIKTLLYDYLGVALGGAQTDSGRIAAEFALDLGSAEEAGLIGFGRRAAAPNAAFANAICSHSIELDDVDDLAYFHFSPPVYSAALAMAEKSDASGRDLLTALTAGCDVMARLSLAMNPSLRNRGFHTTPTCGVFGAAAAAAKLLGLSAAEVTSAMGLAGAQASGLMEMYGTSMQKRFNPGPAAWGGVVAALMAQRGFTGAETILEGERGFMQAFCDQFDVGPLLAELGKDFPIRIEYKAYSCARPIHNAIDCALAVRQKHQPALERIAAMTMYRHPRWAHYHQIAKPRTYHEAQMSLPFSVAVAFKEGKAFWHDYSEENLNDPLIQKMAGMLVIKPDESLPRGVSCRLIVTMDSGDELTAQVDYPKGSIQNPLTMPERIKKFEALASHRLDAEKQAQVREAVFGLETIEKVSALMDLVRGGE